MSEDARPLAHNDQPRRLNMRQIVLLRAVNLGARNRIAMPELRELLTGAGFAHVQTYLQSGNVVLESRTSPGRVAGVCERAIADGLGVQIDAIARTREELAEVVLRDPLGKMADDPKRYQVSFLSAEPDAETVERIAALAVAPERLHAHGRELYAWHPDGVGRSRLAARLGKPGPGIVASARNWTTVTKLLELASQ